MSRAVVALTLVLALVAFAPGAEQDPELKAAQVELKLAREYLEAAGRRYGEARSEALAHVKRAMREIRLGLLDAAMEREHGPAYRHTE